MTAPWATQALAWGLLNNQAVADKGRSALGKGVCPSVSVVVTALQALWQLLMGSRPVRAGLGVGEEEAWGRRCRVCGLEACGGRFLSPCPIVALTASWRMAPVPNGRDGRTCSEVGEQRPQSPLVSSHRFSIFPLLSGTNRQILGLLDEVRVCLLRCLHLFQFCSKSREEATPAHTSQSTHVPSLRAA